MIEGNKGAGSREAGTSAQRRRRWSVTEKSRFVEEILQPGMSVSLVSRRTIGVFSSDATTPDRQRAGI
jgi:transposase-like protein